MWFAVEGWPSAQQCLPAQPGKSQIIFPPKALLLNSKVILGKLLCLILHKTEIDLHIQRTLLPMATRPHEKVNNVNGIVQNWGYQSSWSELPWPQKSLPRSIADLLTCTVVNHPSEYGYFAMHTNWGTCCLTKFTVHGSPL